MKPVVIVPTYNERENIGRLIPKVLGAVPEATVLVVDDSSPDGTAEEARRLGEKTGRVDVLVRPRRMGMG
ncbi:MAG TPA: glycosyltransferase, partial [Armatimonadetes bacterium]|nr:glycosyltransferase [Armatimonadota bacterium]